MHKSNVGVVLLYSVLYCDAPVALPVENVAGIGRIYGVSNLDQQRPKAVELDRERFKWVNGCKEKVSAPCLLKRVEFGARKVLGRNCLRKRRKKLAAVEGPSVVRASQFLVTFGNSLMMRAPRRAGRRYRKR